MKYANTAIAKKSIQTAEDQIIIHYHLQNNSLLFHAAWDLNLILMGQKMNILERRKNKMWLPYLATYLSESWHCIFTLGLIIVYSSAVCKLLLIIYKI